MGSPLVRTSLSFLFPGGALFALTLAAVTQPQFTHLLAPAADIYAAVVFVVALLLGWRFDRSRLVFSTVVIALGLTALQRLGPRPTGDMRLLFDAVALLLPLNIGLLALAKERGIFSWHGLLRWALILVQPLVLWLLFLSRHQPWLAPLQAELLPVQHWEGMQLRQPALFTFMLALFISSFQGLSRHNLIENGMFWALLLLFYAVLGHHPHTTLTLLFASAALILVIAVIEASYSMAYRDELTGLPARRALNHDLLKLGSRYTVAMLDVDHFKKFNDSYGHDVGDEVLKMVAAKIATVKGGGKAYRYGGEEFTVLFPGKEKEACRAHLERLREMIAESGFTVRGGKRKKGNGGERRVNITISIGAAERQDDARDPHSVIKVADKALYRAKKAGRNCVMM